MDTAETYTFLGMQAFVIFMVAFFFLFVYYCIFGFVVGAIAESNMKEHSADDDEKIKVEL